jgi:hypothetical protein
MHSSSSRARLRSCVVCPGTSEEIDFAVSLRNSSLTSLRKCNADCMTLPCGYSKIRRYARLKSHQALPPP